MISTTESVTLELQNHFVGPGDPGRPLDTVVDMLHETRRTGFLRGLVEREDDPVASFTGIRRKPGKPR